ncbi:MULTISPECIES: flavin reductase family protein [Novosphingobium]|uniref:NADH-FMN oxidoreductase RutF, flavin reductase (DIM6/NTAB) family n=1 Tax=Novosphingobium mathurense TaxID=428990 RepID=A0A1U6HXS6_9SPHN|nr:MULTISPECIES: flavin reductase family protein [Novosphingobium]CDO34487.1 Flavin reductase domain protein, FMN-binding [Novosphingobium sp. KN65.2]SLK00471.1 NADH-FMN oxidoreductase RutF, flavin reductase (DIM6/NTAB) family [Novosphingobium mathurense]
MQQTENSAFADQMKRVLRHLPAPVGIVTSYDPQTEEPVGLAMSAMMPVSLEPCAMAIAINRSGSAHDAMIRAGRFCVNLLASEHHAALEPFASYHGRDRRFVGPEWQRSGKVWYIDSAPANLFCEIGECLPFGTHDVLVGKVYDLRSNGGQEILGWANGSLGRLAPITAKAA